MGRWGVVFVELRVPYGTLGWGIPHRLSGVVFSAGWMDGTPLFGLDPLPPRQSRILKGPAGVSGVSG